VDGISFLVHFDALTVLVLQQLSSTIQLPVRFSFGRNRQKDKQGRQTDRQTETYLTDSFSRITWVSRHQKGQTIWILMKKDVVRWQWQLAGPHGNNLHLAVDR